MSATDSAVLLTSPIVSVLYAKFDTSVGNTIAFAYPFSREDVMQCLDCPSLHDYAFPDGAHEHATDVVHAVIRTRSDGHPARDGSSLAASLEGVHTLYCVAFYRQHRDAAADRGAAQRSLMILTTVPLFSALQCFFQQVVSPFFDSVPIHEGAAHETFAEVVFNALSDAFSIRTGRAEWSTGCSSPKVRLGTVSQKSAVTVDQKGTHVNQAPDPERCDQRVIRLSTVICAAEPQTAPHLLASSRGANQPTNPTNDGARESVLFECDAVVPVLLAKPSAPPHLHLAYGASLKQLLATLGSYHTAVVHWCLWTRVPVLFLGRSATEVSDAVRAAVLMIQPIDVHESRFAPYLTLDGVDYFAKHMTEDTVYVAVGATNAYVCHKEFKGAVKCHLPGSAANNTSGLVGRLVSSVKVEAVGNVIQRIPKAHLRAFDDLCAAARDPSVGECYIRARCCRFNLSIMEQLVGREKGMYYDVLSRIPNLVHQPLIHVFQPSPSVSAEACLRAPSVNPLREVTAGEQPSSEDPLPIEIEGRAHSSTDFVMVDASPATSPDAGSTRPVTSEAVIHETEVEGGDAGTTDFDTRTPSGRRYHALFTELRETIAYYEDHAKRNHSLIRDVDVWFSDMGRILDRIAVDSHRWHRALISELRQFSPLTDEAQIPDCSLMYCASDLAGACRSRLRFDRTQRLRLVQDYQERVYLMIDALGKHNTRALLRRNNKYVSDFFSQWPQADAYAIQQQVLLHSTACDTTWYVQRAKVHTTGTLHLTKNYLLFEAGAMSVRRRHQIVPFDCIRSVGKDETSLFSTNIRCALEYPTAESASTSALVVISDIANSDGFFQLLHALVHRQRRLIRLMGSMPCPHLVPLGVSIGVDSQTHAVPRVIPVGLYAMQDQYFFDEVWENQRLYPIVGWSSKLLPSDPSPFSDFSLCRKKIDMANWPCCDGFALVYDWRLASELRDVDTNFKGLLTDELMLKYGKIATPFSERRTGGTGELGGDDDGMPDGGATQLRSPRRLGSPSVAATAPDVAEDKLQFLYNSSWTNLDSFRVHSFVGCTIRRRLWVRVRRALIPQVSQLPDDERRHSRDADVDTISTSSSDMVESGSDIALMGIATPLLEEDDVTGSRQPVS